MPRLTLSNGIWVDIFAKYQDAIDMLVDRITEKNYFFVNFIYFASYVLQEKSPSYRKALLNSDFLLLDGLGMTLYVKFIYKYPGIFDLNGTDLIPQILETIDTKHPGFPICLYGSTIEMINDTFSTLAKRHKRLDFYYHQDGYSPLNFGKLRERSVLLVGLGTPKQENFAHKNREFFQKKKIAVITVGGLFDFISGGEKRAPRFIRTMKLEWCYRMLQDPKKNYKKNLRNLLFPYILFRDFLKTRYVCRL